ncbi:MAG: PAS domain-containing protein [Planctomycetes bacterium]|nr:PAS domain-containing protein [Planctomycetota bacterium]
MEVSASPARAHAEFEIPRPGVGNLREPDALHLAFEAERLGVWSFDDEARTLTWSAGFADLVGGSAEPGSGPFDAFLARLHAEDRARLVDAFVNARSDAGPFACEVRILHPDGSHRWVLLRGRPRPDETGGGTRFAGIATDVTDRRRHEDELRAKEARLARTNELLEAVSRVQAALFESDFELAAERLLEDFLRLSGSERVWLGRVVPAASAPSRIELVWQERGARSSALVASDSSALERAFARVIAARVPSFTHERAPGCALPGLVGLPLLSGGTLVGVVGFGGRANGYDVELAAWLEPLTSACARWLEGRAIDARRRAAEQRVHESERRYRSLVAASTALVWSTNPEGRFVEPQPAWEAFTGQAWPAHAGTGWLDCIHGEDRERVRAEWHSIVRACSIGEVEARLWHAPSRAWRIVRARAVPLLAPSGSVERWIGTIEDVHDRRAAVERLRASEECLRVVLRATNDVVWDWDLARGELRWSQRYAETFGYPAQDLVMSVDECDRRVHPDDRAGLEASLAVALEGGDTLWTHEYRYRHADGSWQHVQDRGCVLRDETGRAVRMLGALQDVTRRRQSELELRQAELLYRGLVHSVKAVLWRANPRTLSFDFVSQEAASFGYPLEAWLEPGFWAAHLHPDDRERAISICTRATRELRDHEFEYRFLAADGRVVWLRDRATVQVEDGRVVGLVGVLFDITELKQAQERVQSSEERFRALYEQALVAMARSGLDGRLLDANPAFCSMLGYEREELASLTAADVSHPEDWPRNAELRAEVLSGARSGFQIEKRYRRKNGSFVWCRATVTLVRGARGEPDCFLGVLEDATERKETERVQRELNQELERRVQERTVELQSTLRELESFSYSVSHDLRAPLRGMDGFSQLLLEEHGHQLDEEARGWLRRIRANCASMSQLIDGLLALARLSRDELVLGVVDLAPIAREIVDGLRAAEPAREVELRVSGDLRAHADPRLMRTLLENLLGNAWKFSARRPRARIELSVEPGPTGERTYCVSDDGVGFDPVHATRLFEPFERLHSQADFPGSGIGLATVQRIVRRHGGEVWIEGAPGRGARVFFTLGPR